jgi:hypothetical protein
MKTVWILLIFSMMCLTNTTDASETHITIYNKDLGLVQQVRTVNINSTDLPLQFSDVAAKLIPTSVHLRPLGDNQNIQVLEQLFEYDLINSEKLLERYIDQPIEIIRKNGDLIKGILLSKQGGSLVIKTADKVTIVPWNNEITIHLAELPKDLITRPTLKWELAGTTVGKQNLQVSYLTNGLGWHTDYIAVLDDKSIQLNLAAWVSVNNQCGATFQDVHLTLVAGDINRVQKQRAAHAMAKDMREAAAPGFKEEDMFEYHTYELGRITTLKNKQIKQITLFSPAVVKAEKKFFYNANRDAKKVEVRVMFTNDPMSGLGKPLPAGIFRIYQKNDEKLVFIGEDQIDHTPRNKVVKITLGKAFDLSGERIITYRKRVAERTERQTVEIELRNNKPQDEVTIVVEEMMYHRYWEIEKTNFPYAKKDTKSVEFNIPVNAESKSTLQYTVLFQF